MQAFGVALAMRVLGVHRALYVLPVLLVAGATFGVVGLGMWAAIALRGIDGTFRQSLQKTCVELLFVPLPDDVRARAKPVVDLLGQRGGQALTSVLIFGLAAIGSRLVGHAVVSRIVGGIVLVVALGWIGITLSLRSRYLDLFRATLGRGRIELGPEMPELDVTALEVLIGSLNSRRDAQVLGALELLAAQRGALIPSLVLFHPSRDVVLRALELLVATGRTDYHALVRGTAPVRQALARALGEVRVDGERWAVIEKTLLALAKDEDRTVRELSADAMGHHAKVAFVPVLLRMLDEGAVGLRAIGALAQMGDLPVTRLDAALDAEDVADETKWRCLRVLARIATPAAVACLLRRIGATGAPMELRALRALRAAQTTGAVIPVDDRKVRDLAMTTIDELARALAFRLAQAEHATRSTVGGSLLSKLLVDTEVVATDRLFLLLGLLHPDEHVTRIQRGLASKNPRTRASSLELLQNLLASPLRERVLAVVDDVSDAQRLARIGAARTDASHAALLGAMLAERGALGDLAAYHANELDLEIEPA